MERVERGRAQVERREKKIQKERNRSGKDQSSGERSRSGKDQSSG